MTQRTTTLAAVAAPNAATPAAHPVRIAVLADSTASPAQIAAASDQARVVSTRVTVRRVSAAPEARAAAAELAAAGYDVVAAAGPQSRAAVGEADAAGLTR
jgi:hypothetical protein